MEKLWYQTKIQNGSALSDKTAFVKTCDDNFIGNFRTVIFFFSHSIHNQDKSFLIPLKYVYITTSMNVISKIPFTTIYTIVIKTQQKSIYIYIYFHLNPFGVCCPLPYIISVDNHQQLLSGYNHRSLECLTLNKLNDEVSHSSRVLYHIHTVHTDSNKKQN